MSGLRAFYFPRLVTVTLLPAGCVFSTPSFDWTIASSLFTVIG